MKVWSVSGFFTTKKKISSTVFLNYVCLYNWEDGTIVARIIHLTPTDATHIKNVRYPVLVCCSRCKYPSSGIAWLLLLHCSCLFPVPQAITLRQTLLVPTRRKEEKATSSFIPSSIHPAESTLGYLWRIFHGLNGFVSGMDAHFCFFVCLFLLDRDHTYLVSLMH